MLKKKGRRPNSYYENLKNKDISNNIYLNTDNCIIDLQDISKNLPKKRGRKPKGGKIVENKNIITNNKIIPNIILHLKCKISELNMLTNIYDPNIKIIKNFNIENNINNNKLVFKYLENNSLNETDFMNVDKISCKNDLHIIDNILEGSIDNSVNNINNSILENFDNKISSSPVKNKCNVNKNLSNKINELSKKFKTENSICKSACFWCTYDFDNEPVMIPKYELKGTIYGYGHFCSPECAVAYLMNEHIDSSNKFERYYLLNNLYGSINNYSENIKLAPNPYYTLDKYYGNLTIQEYRQLLKSERLLITLEKPLSKLLPEVCEENNENILTNKIVTRNNFKIKQKNC